MSVRLRLTLLVTASAGAVFAITAYAVGGESTASGIALLVLVGSVLVAALAAAAEWFVFKIRRQQYQRQLRGNPEPRRPEPLCASAEQHRALCKVRLAKEYADGIALLVDVAALHQTPLPHAAVRNLRYLSRLLKQAEDILSATHEIQPATGDEKVHIMPTRSS